MDLGCARCGEEDDGAEQAVLKAAMCSLHFSPSPLCSSKHFFNAATSHGVIVAVAARKSIPPQRNTAHQHTTKLFSCRYGSRNRRRRIGRLRQAAGAEPLESPEGKPSPLNPHHLVQIPPRRRCRPHRSLETLILASWTFLVV